MTCSRLSALMNGNFPMKKPLRWIYDEVVKLWLMVDVLGLAGLPP